MQLRSDVNHLRFVMVTLIYDYQSQLFSFKLIRDITAIISKCLKQNQNEINKNNNATHRIDETHSKQVSSVIDNCKGHTLFMSGYNPRWHYSGNSSMAMRYFRLDITRKNTHTNDYIIPNWKSPHKWYLVQPRDFGNNIYIYATTCIEESTIEITTKMAIKSSVTSAISATVVKYQMTIKCMCKCSVTIKRPMNYKFINHLSR